MSQEDEKESSPFNNEVQDITTSDLFVASATSKDHGEPVEQRVVDDNDNDDLFGAPDTVTAKATTAAKGEVASATAVLPDTSGTSSHEVAAKSASKAGGGDEVDEDLLEDSKHHIEIFLSDPKKIGDGMGAYMVYKVTTRTNIKHFKSHELVVTRRFSDFLGLHEKLVARYQPQGIIIPPPPEKSVIGMTKIKVMKEESGSLEFVEKRRAALERFLNRIAKHPQLCADTDFVDFLELDGDLPKASGTSTLSGQSFVRLLNRVGDSIGKFTYTMMETDDWFEDKTEQLDMLDRELQLLHASMEVLVINRKDLAQGTQLFAKSVAILGSTEEHMSLSKALSQLSETETKLYQLHADQADTDFFVMSELIKDYVTVIQSIKEVLSERIKVNKVWKDAEAALVKKQDEKLKLEQQQKTDKLAIVNQEITELESRVAKGQEDFDKISATIRKEITRLERQKVRDFRSTIINYLQCMMNYQQQISACWESFLPEARDIA